MKFFIILTFLELARGAALDNLKWVHDCNNIDPAAKQYVDDKIANSKVYLIGLSYCGWCTKAKEYLQRMGYSQGDIVVDDLDEMENKMAIINYAYCQYTQLKTVPQVFISGEFVGGFTGTRHVYYTGQGVQAAYWAGSIPDYETYQKKIKQAALDFVDEGTARSTGGKYFVLSKTRCPHCFNAKDCLKEVGVRAKDIELHEINDFLTHDWIKIYKGQLAETSFTPYLAYNGKTLYNHAALVRASGCSPLHYGTE